MLTETSLHGSFLSIESNIEECLVPYTPGQK